MAGAEDLVPEEGDLLFQGAHGVDHPEGPFFLLALQSRLGYPLRLIAHQHVALDCGLPVGVQQLIHSGLVTLGGTGLQLFIRRSETGPAHQVGH